MASITKKVSERLAAGLKKFQPILEAARSRDVNESDTVVIVTDLLSEIFGYDKYSEITSEHAIRGTYCDLAVKIDATLELLIEVKAIGLELRDPHVKQAVDYATNQGVDWVVLTNGIVWKAYKVVFAKPIEHEQVLEFDLTQLNHRSAQDLDLLWLLAKEGWQKARLGDYHAQRQALSRFSLGALVLSNSVVSLLRRELKRISPGVKIEQEEIIEVLETEVLKRDVVEGENAKAAKKLISKAANKALRSSRPKKTPKPKPVESAVTGHASLGAVSEEWPPRE